MNDKAPGEMALDYLACGLCDRVPNLNLVYTMVRGFDFSDMTNILRAFSVVKPES